MGGDPYAGMNFGGEDQTNSVFQFFDAGLGPTGGLALWGGAELLFHKLQSGKGIRDMLRGSANAALGGKLSSHFTRGLKPSGAIYAKGTKAAQQFLDLSEDVWKSKVRGKGTRGMFHNLVEMNRKAGTSILQRYGAKPAARIAAGHVLGKALTAFNVITSLAFGAELGKMVTQSIADWTPTVAKAVELDFGTGFVEESFQARTMRQQSIAAIHNSQLTVRAALGNEAVHMHS